MTADKFISLTALVVSIIALGCSVYFWRRQFRPIITAAVRTARSGNTAITYNLEILNSGSIPAKNIVLRADESTLSRSLGADATVQNKDRWLSCFAPTTCISILQNQSRVTCSFGTTKANDQGFWKYRAQIKITIEYEGWFGNNYSETQNIEIVDSDSFTNSTWGDRDV